MVTKPTFGTTKACFNDDVRLKSGAIDTYEAQTSLNVEQEVMHVERKPHLMMAIADVANGGARIKKNYSLELRQDMLKISVDP